ncbi:jerky protein homolog-like [Colletes gigas]|uniref:jerky protein homolog-like n=1 Tax=Colletes gigas TaxID=935657 RepID=UPI001C9B07D2|nr:jerky protein homolog-like [Colletes gigas]
MATKRRVSLTVQQRLDALKDLETLPLTSVAAKFNVHPTTIRRIKNNSAIIGRFAEENKRRAKRQRFRKPMYEELEQHLLAWFTERRTLGDILSDTILLQKAIELKNTLAISSDFKVSRGWLSKFKERHNIRLVHVCGEKASADEDGANVFVQDFNKFIVEENINLDCIYNMDESGLLWKALPTKTLAGGNEASVNGYKLRKERVTIALCSNATGTHKIMPLMQRNAWMDQSLFANWYENHFKPSVRDYHIKNGINGPVILLLDNCAGHKVTADTDRNFRIKYLPANTTCLIQPMDQGVIEKTKRSFRRRLMQRVIDCTRGINEFYKIYSIRDCIEMIAESWKEITTDNIRNAWNKIIKRTTFEEEERALGVMQELISLISEDNVSKEEAE